MKFTKQKNQILRIISLHIIRPLQKQRQFTKFQINQCETGEETAHKESKDRKMT